MVAQPAAPTTPPALLPFNPDGVPQILKDRGWWTTCKVTWNPATKRFDKKPINCKTGYGASSTDPDTWCSYEEAYAYSRKTGLAMVLMLQTPLVGMDHDHCVVDGGVDPGVLAMLHDAGTYAEYSISGTGVKQIAIGTKPGTECKNGDFEMYTSARGFVITGHVVGQFTDVVHCQDAIIRAYDQKLAKPETPTRKMPVGSTEPLNLDDDELLKRCEGSALFRQVMNRDDSHRGGDTSRSDLDFANIVVRNGGTRAQVETLIRRFREREKFDRKDGDSTWLEKRVLDIAFDGSVEVRQKPTPPSIITFTAKEPDPEPNRQDAGWDDDVDVEDVDDVQTLRLLLRTERRRRIKAEAEAADWKEKYERCAEHSGKVVHRQKLERRVMQNTAIKAERSIIIALADDLTEHKSKGVDDWFRAPLARVGQLAGVSTDTASKRLKSVTTTIGGVEWRTKRDPDGKQWTEIRGDAEELLRRAAAYRAPQNEETKTWGGKRPKREWTCPDHPDADVKKLTHFACMECGQVSETFEETLTADANPQDAAWVEDLAPTGTDAANSGARTHVDSVLRERKMRHGSASPPTPTPIRPGINQASFVTDQDADRYRRL